MRQARHIKRHRLATNIGRTNEICVSANAAFGNRRLFAKSFFSHLIDICPSNQCDRGLCRLR